MEEGGNGGWLGWEVGGFMPDWMEAYDVTDLFLRLLIVRSD